MTELLDELRIIARDGGRLDPSDRAKIVQMVDHFERLQAELTCTQQALFEENARRMAVMELQPQRASWSMSSGWVQVRHS